MDVSISPEELKQDNGNYLRDKTVALENTMKSHEYNKSLYNKKCKKYNFNVVDMIYVENGNKLKKIN